VRVLNRRPLQTVLKSPGVPHQLAAVVLLSGPINASDAGSNGQARCGWARAATPKTKPVARCPTWRLLTPGRFGQRMGDEVSAYRFLEDASIGQFYYPGGTTASTADVGGTFPVGWVPSPNVDPLDAGALAAFYAVGPVQAGPVRAQFTTHPVPPPTTYWAKQSSGQYQLVGLGGRAGAGVAVEDLMGRRADKISAPFVESRGQRALPALNRIEATIMGR
jgi:hypothetical protein